MRHCSGKRLSRRCFRVERKSHWISENQMRSMCSAPCRKLVNPDFFENAPQEGTDAAQAEKRRTDAKLRAAHYLKARARQKRFE
ncbi:hypothetical protein CT2208 [Chlorobaculum tepidum TLS]|uniref:Uncharacterized protein n=1 Tax=Chlorobaculum tepidum (strain ATCC 49652 / DSM 12025 / NBRC 103806 / TLS) TaxID=194439 RepID=Q8KAF4_CHLTE|nr:hypothetical protein CT2208 [Chlorobaculum tepidum TLS]